MTYISSLSLSTPMRTSVMSLQSQLSQTMAEVSSQTKADIGLSLGAQTGTAISLQDQMDQLNSYTNTNSLASTRLSSTANSLSSIITSVQAMSQNIIQATGVGPSTTLQTSAQNSLQALIGTLNTTSGGQAIFGGINTASTPLADYTAGSTSKTAVDAAFAAAFPTQSPQSSSAASTITGPQMQSFLDNQFAALFNNANWQANWSSASDQTIQTAISPSESATTSVSANNSSIRQVAQAYTMLSELTGPNLSTDALNAVMSTASKLLSNATSGLNNVASGVGVVQSRLDDANTNISSQVDVLTSSVNSLEGVDTAALSTQVTQLQNQLQASYELTSKLSQLSLVNYLTTG
jgi:flagellar hook-associated protein 3 FlgL